MATPLLAALLCLLLAGCVDSRPQRVVKIGGEVARSGASIDPPDLTPLRPPVFEAPLLRILPPPGTNHLIPTNVIPILWPANMPTNYYSQFLIQRSTNLQAWQNFGLATNLSIFINNIGNYTQNYYYRVKALR